jgi:dihydrofolate reductase
MGKVVFDISVSLDGYVAGPNDGPDLGLGEGGERLHDWVVELASWREPHGLEGGETNASSEILEETLSASGAVVVGKRMFDNAHGWGDVPPFGKPVFVLTHTAREPLAKEGGTTFTFVTDGIESAVEQARAAAGDKDVSIGGGASTAQQALKAGLVDEVQLTVPPLLLGGGVRLFEGLGPDDVELELMRVIEGPKATHLRYRVVK